MDALSEHWADVAERLGPAREQELRELVESDLGGAGHTGAVVRITQLLTRELPAEHPVRRALARGYLFAGAPTDRDWPTLRGNLLAAAGFAARAEVPAEDPEDSEDPDEPDEILAGIAGRLLRAPALTADEVRRRGADPGDPGLLRLDRPDGGQQWPSFQFAAYGAFPVVRTVNLMLDAETDPFGVADWWLGGNAWLDGRPSDLIGAVPDEQLLRAARAVTEEV
jgi:hypothetical protein